MVRSLFTIIILLALTTHVTSQVARIWAVDDGEKIKRDDIKNPLADDPANAVWKNNTINLFGGRNEFVAFQLMIQAGPAGAQNVNVTVSDLKNNGSVIPGSAKGPKDPFDYRGRNIELFTEHYLNVVKRSPPLWFYKESARASGYYLGWLPDGLIPFQAPEGKGGAPFAILPDNNQGVWVDILVPKNAKPGQYRGEAVVTVAGKKFKAIPIALEVFNFTIPDSIHIENMFGYSPRDVASRHGLAENSEEYYNMEAKYWQLAHRHRFDLVRNIQNLDEMDRHHKRYLTGEIYNARWGYAGPSENIGNTTFSIGYGGNLPDEYGKDINKATKESWWAGSDAWETWFMKNAPGVKRHKYLFPDEPDWKGPKGKLGTGSMDTIRMQGEWTHSNPGPGKNIPALVSNTIKPVIKGYIDFWTVSSEEVTMKATKESIYEEKSLGNKYGIYNGYRPGNGAVITDADAVEFRVMPWIVWKYDMDQYFYWQVSFWRKTNVFKEALTYENRINGDGTFLYPGEDKIYPDESRGLKGPLSSVRAKNWRRGAQDYEYLWLAKQAGRESEMKKILDECVPAALWDARDLDNIAWSEHGYKFEQARRKLAELIAGAR